ncbi:MAG: divergent polysaccharide deacetylase family protein, partial [Pseudomonadota bacterium]
GARTQHTMTTDVHDSLHAPLKPRAKRGSFLAHFLSRKASLWALLFTQAGGGFLAVILTLIVGWIIVIDNPLGGEPTTQVAIVAGAPETAPSQTGFSQNPGNGFATVPGDLPGGPQVLTVPQPDMPELEPELAPGFNQDAATPRFLDAGRLTSTAHPSLVQRFDARSFVPIMGANGERPLDAYARPLEAGTIAPGQPRIALIIGGLGLSQTSTFQVLSRLPPEATLSFAPYGNSLERWATRARLDGHEYLLEVPMEPFDYPNNDPGPHTLRVELDPLSNVERLHWALSRLPTPIGLINYMGGRFTSDDVALRPVLADALSRGLMVVDDGRSARSRIGSVAGTIPVRADTTPVLAADVVIDARLDQESIDNRLTQLEALARDRGVAVGVASAFPITIETLEEWTNTLARKGIALVPVSSLVRFPNPT